MADTADQARQAVQHGELETLARLLEKEPDLASVRDEHGVSLLMWAKYNRREDHVEQIRAVLERRGELDLLELCALGETERVLARLEREPAALGAWSPDGFTPLHYACFFGHPELARALLERGAPCSLAARNPMAVHPLHSAVAIRSEELTRLLLEHGAEVNARQQQGWTALHSAALHGELGLLRLLVDHGADREARNDDGVSAADLARQKGVDVAGIL